MNTKLFKMDVRGLVRVLKIQKSLIFLPIIIALLLTACGAGSSVGNTESGTTSNNESKGIGPNGGIVTSSNGNVKVIIPSGALNQTTDITVAPISNQPSGNIGTAYEFGPDGTNFSQPVTIFISYDETSLPSGVSESEIKLGIVTNNQWQAITDSEVDAVANVVSGTTTHLSTYGVMAVSISGIVPSVPVGVTAIAGDGQVTISWGAAAGATSYNIYWSTTSGVTKATGTKISNVTSPYIHAGRTNGTTYYYVVTAVNNYGESSGSIQVSATPGATGTVPSIPTSVTAAAGDGQVTISWGAAAGTTPYNIYWSTTAGVTKATGTKISNVASPYIHTGRTNGTTYYYVVTAVNSYGESSGSSQVSATPGATGTVPSIPTSVTAAAGDGEVTISWGAAAGATSYNIYWSTTSSVTKATGTKISNVTSPYVHTSRINGTTYYYVVTAVNGYGESVASTQVSETPQTGLTSPVTTDATNIGTSATLNGSFYNPVGYVSTVWFEYGTTTSYGNSTIPIAYATPGTLNVSANITGLQDLTSYHFRIVTQNATGTFYGNDKSFNTYITPTTLASGLNGPRAIAIDSTSVYWTEYYDGTVKKVSINGGTVETLASGLSFLSDIAVDSTNVYWTEDSNLRKTSINGGTIIMLVSGLSCPCAIAVHSSSVYWTEYYSGTVKKVSINGGIVETLASGLSFPSDIAVDSTNVYWIESSSVKKIGLNGGTVTILSIVGGFPGSITIDSENVYWIGRGGSINLKKMEINGGVATTLASGGSYANDLATDSTNVYWTEEGSNTIRRVEINGGIVTTLASDLAIPWDIAVDSTSIYWAEDGGGTIKKVPKSNSILLYSPTGVNAVAGDGQVAISWNAVSGASAYNIYWSTTPGVTKSTGTKIANVTSPYIHTERTNGTTYYYVVTAVNSYGESSESNQVSATPSATLTPDTTAPSNTIWADFINNGASATNFASVTLSNSASDSIGVTGYYASESLTAPSPSTSGWVSVASTTSYSANITFTLSTGDGTKTIYVRFKDAAGNVSAPASDTITLDTIPPDTTITSQPDNPTNSTSVSFSFTSTEADSTFQCQMDSGGYSACTSPKSYSGLAGSHTFYVKAVDPAGNMDATPASYTWTAIDITAPSNTTTSNFINGGTAYTNSTSVALSISATDDAGVTGYYLSGSSTTPSAFAAGWTTITSAPSYSALISFSLSSGDGIKTVYVWFKDMAGNVSASASGIITLDAVSPTAGTLSAVADNTQVALSWSGFSDAGSGIAAYNLVYSTAGSPSCSAGIQIYSGIGTSFPHTNLTHGITYYYRLCAVDNAGNTSAVATASAATIKWSLLKLPDTGQTGDYTTTLGEDSDYPINLPAYTDNGDGTIMDNVTGLMWQKEDDNTTRTWRDAGTYCDSLTLGGYSDWWLPSKKELISIVSYGAYNSSMNPTYFPNTDSSYYWSSTTYVINSVNAWYVSFYYGDATHSYMRNSHYVRCVRGGK